MKLYTSKQVADNIEVSYRTLMRWVKEELIEPYYYPGQKGQQTLFTRKEFREAIVLSKLRNYFSLEQLRQVMEDLNQLGHNPLSKGSFAIAHDLRGEKVLFKIMEREEKNEIIKLLDANPEGQMVLFPTFRIEEIIDETPPTGEVEDRP